MLSKDAYRDLRIEEMRELLDLTIRLSANISEYIGEIPAIKVLQSGLDTYEEHSDELENVKDGIDAIKKFRL